MSLRNIVGIERIPPRVHTIESLNVVPDVLDLFIAGGISNCPN